LIRAATLLVLALGIQAGLSVRAAEAHIPPPVYMNMEITDDWVEVRLVATFAIFADWFGLAPELLPEDGVVRAKDAARIEARLAGWLHVKIDGIAVQGRLAEAKAEEFQDHAETWRYVNVRMRFDAVVPPRQVAFAWTQYESNTGWVFNSIDAELEAYGATDYPILREREPESIWHRPREAAPPPAIVLPQPQPAPVLTIPLVSTSLLLVLLVGFLVAKARGVSARRRWAVAVLGFGVAAGLAGAAPLDVQLPWGGAIDRPPNDEALAIFASLHRGVYGAVGSETEEEIYDRLAESVSGELLRDLYMDIHQSLILHDEGGAVCRIQKTEILEAEILPEREEGAAWFKVRARWRVEGKVGHWGHTHQRINEYLADVTMVAHAGTWKIARLDVLDESRVDDGRKVR